MLENKSSFYHSLTNKLELSVIHGLWLCSGNEGNLRKGNTGALSPAPGDPSGFSACSFPASWRSCRPSARPPSSAKAQQLHSNKECNAQDCIGQRVAASRPSPPNIAPLLMHTVKALESVAALLGKQLPQKSEAATVEKANKASRLKDAAVLGNGSGLKMVQLSPAHGSAACAGQLRCCGRRCCTRARAR